LTLVVVLAAGTLLAVPHAVGADPLSDADQTVEQLRREADRASGEYFDALETYQRLEGQIAGIEHRLPGLKQRMRRLRALVEHRAVSAYTGSGDQLSSIITSDDAMNAARRTQLLDRLNARDHAASDRLRKARARLESERGHLADARASQSAALEQVKARGGEIDAKLNAAIERKRQLEAEAAAAAAAPAAAQQQQAPQGTNPQPPTGGGAPQPAPAVAPPTYTPTPGVHPHHDDPFLVCTRAHESGGNYAAYNPAGPYMGAYQFLQATWDSAANHAGRLELVGVPPHTASQYDQDDMAWTLYQWRGAGPWLGRCA